MSQDVEEAGHLQEDHRATRTNQNTYFMKGLHANGRPGVHHVLARAFKDMFPRYKIMRGYPSRAAAGGIRMACGLKSKWRAAWLQQQTTDRRIRYR